MVGFCQNAPPCYERVKAAAYQFKRAYASAKVFSLGRSVSGRRIYCLGIGTLRDSRLYVGGVHGSEWLTITALLRFACEVGEKCQNDTEFGAQCDECGVMVVPCLNPDGVEIAIKGEEGANGREEFIRHISSGDFSHYNANLNGVDLNHNFDAGFAIEKKLERKSGITAPAARRFGGEYPGSEPEVHALCTLCNLFEPKVAYALHSQGEEIYYEYGKNTPPQSEEMAKKLAQASGYTLAKQKGLASHGGFKDWFIEKKHRPAFTIEMGKGENPLPPEDFEKIYEKLSPLLWCSLKN